MRVIGHRGARFEAPENTVTGFRHALGVGVDGFELDVHLTKDGQLAVIHDATVDRTTNGSGSVADSTLAELKTLDARATFPEWPESAVIPSLDEVLAVIAATPWIEIEVKTDAPERLDQVVPLVIDAIHRFDITRTAFITSFDRYAIDLAQRLAPEIRRGFICKFDRPSDLDQAIELGASLIGFPYASGLPELATKAREAGILRTGWPTNDRAVVEEAIILELDAVCTDAPTQVKGWLEG